MKKSKNQSKYQRGKAKTIELAMDFQNSFAEGRTWYYSELADFQEKMEKRARRYGLLKELRENAII